MSENRQRLFERRPVALQVRLAVDDVGTFVERYAVNISKGGIFIRSREPRPVGSRLKFLIHLRSGEVVFAGEGTVRWCRTPDSGGEGIAGMGLQFDNLTEESQRVLEQILRAREEERVPAPMEGALPESWPPLGPSTPQASPPTEPTPVRVPPIVTDPSQPSAKVPTGSPSPRSGSRVRAGALVGLEFGWSRIRAAASIRGDVRSLDLGRGGMPAVAAWYDGRLVVAEEAESAMEDGVPGVRGAIEILGQWASPGGARAWRRRQLLDPVAGGDGRWSVELAGRSLDAQALVKALAQEALTRARAALGEPVARAVVAIPTAWTDAQRTCLRRVFEACDVSVDQMISSPLAAVLASGLSTGHRLTLAVGLGEGGSEAALIEQNENVLEVVASAADGGVSEADLDVALVAAVLEQFERETGVAVPEDRRIFERTRRAVGEARRLLSSRMEHEINLPALIPAGLSRTDVRQKITRAWVLSQVGEIVDKVAALARSVLAARQIGVAEVDGFVVFGGVLEEVLFQKRLGEALGRVPEPIKDAADAPAIGAALAGRQEGVSKYLLAGVAGATIGLSTPGGAMKRLIERQLPLPIERGCIVSTTKPDQRDVVLELYQGESAQTAENEYLGRVVIGPLPGGKAGSRVALTVTLDANGEISLRASEGQGSLPVRFDRDVPPAAGVA